MKILLNLPNILTIARIIIIPLFITAIIYKSYGYALYLFAFAALTDKLDGLIAKLKNQKTELGTFLDPLADKFMLVTAFILFSIYGWIPLWLTITVISRDVIVTVGWVLIYLIKHTSKVEPLVSGKLAIASQFILICFILLYINYGLFPAIEKYLIWTTAALTVLSGLKYIHRGLKITGER